MNWFWNEKIIHSWTKTLCELNFILYSTQMMNSKNTGLFITRGQPGLHSGHIDAIMQWISQWVTDILIGVWSANKELTPDNPFTYDERKAMIELSLKWLQCNSVTVVPIPDTGDDQSWKNYITKSFDFDTIITWNPWVENIFSADGKKIIKPEITKIVKASNIRRFLAEDNYNAISDMLDKDVIHYLKHIKAHERLKQLIPSSGTSIATMTSQEIADYIIKNSLDIEIKKMLQGREPITPKIAADIITLYEWKLVLIKRKSEPFGFALPGWFIEVWETIEQGGIREMKEETKVDIVIEKRLPTFDSPTRDPRGHTVSFPFLWKIIWWVPTADDDAEDILLIEPTCEEIEKIHFAFPDHKDMIYEWLWITRLVA